MWPQKMNTAVLWSNPSASPTAVIRATLIRPTFERLLALALEHGLETLQTEWRLLAEEGSVEAQRAAVSVDRILRHIDLGFRRSHATA